MQDTNRTHIHFERPTTERQEFPVVKRIVYMTVVVGLGCIAGAVGFLIAQSQFPTPQYLVYPTEFPGDAPPTTQNRAVYDALSSVRERTVAIVPQRNRGSDLYDQLIDPNEYLGSGVIATSDGWIMTALPATQLNRVAVIIDGAVIPAERLATDQVTGISFLKTDAKSLSPVDIAASLAPGDMLIAFAAVPGAPARPSVARVLQADYVPVRAKLDYVRSSDALSEYALLDPSSEPIAGQAYFTSDGRFAGFVEDVVTDHLIVPPSIARLALDQALRQAAPRDLGIYYIKTEASVSSGQAETGVLVFHPTRAAVRIGSLAAKAGLLKGDRITRIAGEGIDQQRSFDYLWKKHQHDMGGVELVIVRNGVEGPIQIAW